ncbi:hypothetical protein HK405_014939, partial [Cladochytrium tenue]
MESESQQQQQQALIAIVSIVVCGVGSVVLFPYVRPFLRSYSHRRGASSTTSGAGAAVTPISPAAALVTSASSREKAIEELLQSESSGTSSLGRHKRSSALNSAPRKASAASDRSTRRPSSVSSSLRASPRIPAETVRAASPSTAVADSADDDADSIDDLLRLQALSGIQAPVARKRPSAVNSAPRASSRQSRSRPPLAPAEASLPPLAPVVKSTSTEEKAVSAALEKEEAKPAIVPRAIAAVEERSQSPAKNASELRDGSKSEKTKLIPVEPVKRESMPQKKSAVEPREAI